jgi:hypothetical protein
MRVEVVASSRAFIRRFCSHRMAMRMKNSFCVFAIVNSRKEGGESSEDRVGVVDIVIFACGFRRELGLFCC